MKKLLRKLYAPFLIFSLSIGAALSSIHRNDEVVANAAPTTVTVTRADFTGGPGYALGTWSKGGISGEGVIYFTSTQYIQVSTTAGRQPYPHNLVPTPGPITSISVTMPGSGTLRSLTPRLSATAAVTEPDKGTPLSTKTFTSNTQTLTWDIDVSENYRYFHLVPGGNTNWANFTFTYEEVTEEFGELDHIELDTSNAKLSYYVGDEFTLDGLGVTAFDTNGISKILLDGYTSSLDGYTFVESDLGSKEVIISYEEAGVSVTANFTIEIVPAPILQHFNKVTSLHDFHIGASYVIVGVKEDVKWVMSTIQSGNNRTAIEASVSGDEVVETEDTQIFTLEKGHSANSFAFKAVNGDTAGQYIYAAGGSSNNYLRSQETLDANASWRLLFNEEGILSAVAQGTGSRNILRLNATQNLFSAYEKGQLDIELYVNLETILPNPFAEAYNVAYDINVGLGNEARGDCHTIYNALYLRYTNLSDEAKAVFDEDLNSDFLNARERLAYLQNYVGATTDSTLREANKANNTNVFSIIAIAGIGLSAIVIYHYLNKRKTE